MEFSNYHHVSPLLAILTHWGRVTHICVVDLTIIGSDNGLSPGRRQAIIWTNAGILLIGPLGTNFSEIVIEIQTFLLKKNTFENVVCEMLFISSRPQCVKVGLVTGPDLFKKSTRASLFSYHFLSYTYIWYTVTRYCPGFLTTMNVRSKFNHILQAWAQVCVCAWRYIIAH